MGYAKTDYAPGTRLVCIDEKCALSYWTRGEIYIVQDDGCLITNSGKRIEYTDAEFVKTATATASSMGYFSAPLPPTKKQEKSWTPDVPDEKIDLMKSIRDACNG